MLSVVFDVHIKELCKSIKKIRSEHSTHLYMKPCLHNDVLAILHIQINTGYWWSVVSCLNSIVNMIIIDRQQQTTTRNNTTRLATEGVVKLVKTVKLINGKHIPWVCDVRIWSHLKTEPQQQQQNSSEIRQIAVN